MKFCCYILVLLHALLFACATPGAPIGGPKDETPPKHLKTLPENFTTNFTGNRISFYFNELIALKDMNNQLIVSPPLVHRPDIKDNGKVVNVIIKDTLLPNTTYNFDFGDAITDNNEGNVLKKFSYTFSTGSYIDTLTICGKVLDALTLEPKKQITVLLHDTLQSVFNKQNIRAIARTDNEGNFCLSNLNNEARYVIALGDANKDNKYDTIQDTIGFFPEKSVPKFLYLPVYPDSCSSEDSTRILDSITLLNDYHPVTILTFKQKLVQTVVKSEFVHPYKIALGFRNEMKDKPSIECIQPNISRDSLYLRWISKSEVEISLPKDTAVVKNAVLLVNYGNRNDTLRVANTKVTAALDKLKVEAKFGTSLPYFEKFTITTSRPIREILKDKIRYFVNDTTTVPLNFTLIDAANIVIDYPFDSIKQHKILVPDS
ncbi:MAG: Ig-like domain-containing protein, partial [Bacteroidales bacterium]|nr:Ig-like domain-containing protein [Bacteroidales bacterium]